MALKEAGLCPVELWLGNLRIVIGKASSASSSATSPVHDYQDEIAKHFANARF